MYGERAALYGTGEKANPRKRERLRGREGRVWRGAAAVRDDDGGDPRQLRREPTASGRACTWCPNGCDPPERAFTGLPEGEPRDPLRGPALSLEGRRRAGRGVRAGAPRAARDPGRAARRSGHRARAARSCDRAGPGRAASRCLGPSRRRASRKSCAAPPWSRCRSCARAMTERHTSPLKAFEAMAAGRPIVATDLPSHARGAAPRTRTRCSCRPAMRGALAAASRRLLDDRDARRAPGARRACRARPRYSWDARARRPSSSVLRGGAVSGRGRPGLIALFAPDAAARHAEDPRRRRDRVLLATCARRVRPRPRLRQRVRSTSTTQDPAGPGRLQGDVPRPARAATGRPHQLRADGRGACCGRPFYLLAHAGVVRRAGAGRVGARPTASRGPTWRRSATPPRSTGLLGLLLLHDALVRFGGFAGAGRRPGRGRACGSGTPLLYYVTIAPGFSHAVSLVRGRRSCSG